jgi:hypothetical protein
MASMNAAPKNAKKVSAPQRGWEKTPQKKGGSSNSPAPTITTPQTNRALTFHANTSMDEKQSNRNTYLFFLQSLIGCEVEVFLADGRAFKGVFNTATPFSSEDFKVVLKLVRRSVRIYDNDTL